MSAELFERLEREFLAHEEASAVSAAAHKRKSRKAASNKVTRAYASAPFELVEHPAGMASSMFASATGPSDPPGKGTRKRVRRRRADGQAAGGGGRRGGGYDGGSYGGGSYGGGGGGGPEVSSRDSSARSSFDEGGFRLPTVGGSGGVARPGTPLDVLSVSQTEGSGGGSGGGEGGGGPGSAAMSPGRSATGSRGGSRGKSGGASSGGSNGNRNSGRPGSGGSGGGGAEGKAKAPSQAAEFQAKMNTELLAAKSLQLPYLEQIEYVKMQLQRRGFGGGGDVGETKEGAEGKGGAGSPAAKRTKKVRGSTTTDTVLLGARYPRFSDTFNSAQYLTLVPQPRSDAWMLKLIEEVRSGEGEGEGGRGKERRERETEGGRERGRRKGEKGGEGNRLCMCCVLWSLLCIVRGTKTCSRETTDSCVCTANGVCSALCGNATHHTPPREYTKS